LKKVLPTAIAIATGLIVLVDFFVRNPVIDGIGLALLDWAIILAAFAFIVGIFNILIVHFSKIIKRRRGWPYSIFLILAMWSVLIIGVLEPQGPQSQLVGWVFSYVQYPLQATFFALLAFFALSAGYRAFRYRSVEMTIMLLTVALVLLGQALARSDWGVWFVALKNWILSVPTVAGTRGILLGVALGIIATGLRLLIGIDRPYVE